MLVLDLTVEIRDGGLENVSCWRPARWAPRALGGLVSPPKRGDLRLCARRAESPAPRPPLHGRKPAPGAGQGFGHSGLVQPLDRAFCRGLMQPVRHDEL